MEVIRAMGATGARTVQHPKEAPTIATTETRGAVAL